MNLSTLLRRASLVCAAITVALTSRAAEVTLNGFTTVGESKAIQVTYALNKTEKVARVRRVNDTYTSYVPELDNTFNHEIYDKAVVNVKPELAPQFSKASFWEYFNWDKYGLAIDDIAIDNYDSNRPVEYYTLQGVRADADNLTPGIYIRRHNGRSEKIAIR